MTPLELQRALAAMPPRAAQTLVFRCVEGRSAAECAALYGIGLPQWQLLFLDAARSLVGQSAPLDDQARPDLAQRLQRLLDEGGSEPDPLVDRLRGLTEHRDEVRRLTLAAEEAAARSPARQREGWLRRIAVVLIIVASIYVWLRDKGATPAPGPRDRPTAEPR